MLCVRLLAGGHGGHRKIDDLRYIRCLVETNHAESMVGQMHMQCLNISGCYKAKIRNKNNNIGMNMRQFEWIFSKYNTHRYFATDWNEANALVLYSNRSFSVVIFVGRQNAFDLVAMDQWRRCSDRNSHLRCPHHCRCCQANTNDVRYQLMWYRNCALMNVARDWADYSWLCAMQTDMLCHRNCKNKCVDKQIMISVILYVNVYEMQCVKMCVTNHNRITWKVCV